MKPWSLNSDSQESYSRFFHILDLELGSSFIKLLSLHFHSFKMEIKVPPCGYIPES